ncbi:rCG43446 [Rattus norvegicus]|uniref:RCG43446 n=1 Tax=Rattus norvegicus TaxID=10116 RepID=A6JJB8_RAT|nr:rCG43446 [Rattus norvegicus]
MSAYMMYCGPLCQQQQQQQQTVQFTSLAVIVFISIKILT